MLVYMIFFSKYIQTKYLTSFKKKTMGSIFSFINKLFVTDNGPDLITTTINMNETTRLKLCSTRFDVLDNGANKGSVDAYISHLVYQR